MPYGAAQPGEELFHALLRTKAGVGLVKIGISGNIKNRLKALNLSFPPRSVVQATAVCRQSGGRSGDVVAIA
jgi:hypothetical protein